MTFSIILKKKMAHQLPIDCLYEVLKFLEDDKVTSHSCLLVNRFWCRTCVKILWKNIWSFESYYDNVSKIYNNLSKILRTLIVCLPNESQELLRENEIFIPATTLNS